MSGDVQPRKRKDKRKFKRDEEEIIHNNQLNVVPSDEVIHVHKENKLGGNFCSKIIFFGLLGTIAVMIGLIIIEFHGSSDVDTQSVADSPWSLMLEGWVDDNTVHDDAHDDKGEHIDDDDHEGELEHWSHEEEDNEKHDAEDDPLRQENIEEELSEGEQTEEEESFVQQTYNDLQAAYNQEDSEAEPTEDIKTTDYEATESEPEISENESQTEDEDDEDDAPEDDPLGQWKSVSGPEILAGEVEDVQTESETEEESEDDNSLKPQSGGSSFIKIEGGMAYQELGNEVSEEILENYDEEGLSESKIEDELYVNADITNNVDQQIINELDEADQDLDEGAFEI